uniref:Uncharacterized protein n=1 Tax=Arundo donax TaxID=35708 RepID=A0A0A9PZZ5_ARUDO
MVAKIRFSTPGTSLGGYILHASCRCTYLHWMAVSESSSFC